VSQIEEQSHGQASPSRNPNRLYILIAAILVVVIVVAVILLITEGIPALKGEQQATATTEAQATPTQVPTFTPRPTQEPIDTAPPPSPTTPSLVMSDTDTPIFDFESAGARPSVAWTGFFGQVQDAAGNPVEGVPVIIWYRDGEPASPAVRTGPDGSYEIRLADAPLAGTWTIQLLTDDNQPASKLFTFQTDENTETGIQQIQVLWKQIP
jgi:hypothetical protein